MIGNKTLAVPGPTNMPFEIRQAMDVALEDHRAPDFPEFVNPLLNDLKSVFRLQSGRVFVFPGSGTAGWGSRDRQLPVTAGHGPDLFLWPVFRSVGGYVPPLPPEC